MPSEKRILPGAPKYSVDKWDNTNHNNEQIIYAYVGEKSGRLKYR
jgi:hypothetical protein